MISYILSFYFVCIFALLHEIKLFHLDNKNTNYYKIFFIIFLSIYIGLRDNVGGDWGTYYQNYFYYKLNIGTIDFLREYMINRDPLFHLINFIVIKIYPSYYLVNFICAFIFSYCLIYFCFSLPRPFLGILIAIPYLITVVAMGYHRQALAVSFFMVGLVQLEKSKYTNYYISIFIATCFHFTSVFLLLFGIFSAHKFKFTHLFLFLILVLIFCYFVIGRETISALLNFYIFQSYSSAGAVLRILICALASIIFLTYKDHNLFYFKNIQLYKNLSYFSLILFLLCLLLPSMSTVIDRLAIYLIPFQIIIFTSFINLFSKKNYSSFIIFSLIVIGYFSILIIWLYFGVHSLWWHPYSNLLF